MTDAAGPEPQRKKPEAIEPAARRDAGFRGEFPLGDGRAGGDVIVIALAALFAPWITPQNPYDLAQLSSWTTTCPPAPRAGAA
jgi:peptide/nickel transport system permease protein